MSGGVENYKQIVGQLKGMRGKSETVIKRTLSDIRKRGPGWVADGIVQEYAVKKGEITGGKLGAVKVTGSTIDTIQLKFEGRVLTPVHFNMGPKMPKANRGGYTLKMTVKKGQRKTVGEVKKLTKKQRANIGRNFTRQGTRNSPESPYMLSTTGNKKAGGVDFIPFQRRIQPGKLKYALRTVSLPQMVREGKDGPLHPQVKKNLDEKLEKRFEHHMKLLLK